jgi:diguanylate cyclase (GGDEF)-like protein/PAS domain S-box-containing protein
MSDNFLQSRDTFNSRQCLDDLPIGLFMVQESGDLFYFNPEAERILGIDGKDYVNQPLDSLICELTDEQGVTQTSWLIEFTNVCHSRKQRYFSRVGLRMPKHSKLSWVRLVISYVVETSHNAGYVMFSLIDISDLYRELVQKSLHAELFEMSGEAIVITDHAYVVRDVNETFCILTGENRDDVIGKKSRLLTIIKQDPKVYDNFKYQLQSSQFWQGEVIYKGKYGNIPVLLSVSKLKSTPESPQASLVFIFSDITELKLARERLDFLAYHDPLTRLPNRSMCQLRFQHSVDRVSRTGNSVALLYFDLDDFKNINDSLGHNYGDLLLKQCAERLKQSVRKQDTVARLGGDEFLIILEDIQDFVQLEAIAKKLLKVMEPAFDLGKQQRYVTSSLGIAVYPSHGRNFEELLKHADAALHSSKSSGRNDFRIYRTELTETLSRRAQLEHDLRSALSNHAFELYFQPQLSLKTTTICGAEALLRWNHPSGELVSPAEFIPIIEHTGLIVPVGRWVIKDALEKLKIWRAQGIDLPRVAVNVSAIQLHNDQLPDYLCHLLDELDMTPDDLEIEITESVFVDDSVIPKVLQKLHQQGFYLALDDFGTGYSSLSYLTRLPFNKIKLDRSFVAKIETDPSSRAMAKSLVALAKTLGFEVTAEGVENIEQLYFLLEQGCDQVQGYYIGRPVSNDLFIRDTIAFSQSELRQKIDLIKE